MKYQLTKTQKTRAARWPRGLSLMILLLSASASAGPVPVVQAGATISGLVTFRGTVPPPQEVEVTRHPEFCGATVVIQPLIVHPASHGVKDAVVSLSAPPTQTLEAVQPPSVIKNRKCSFAPRISVMRTGALIEIGNDDPIMHNTHIRSAGKTILNLIQPAQAQNVQKQVKKSGEIDMKCDAHKFMQGHVWAFDHSLYAITDETGRFQVTGVPPGPQRITIWHETLGTLQKEVNVPAQGEISVHMAYPEERR